MRITRDVLLGAIVIACSLALHAQQPQTPKPAFETKAELVLVDVNVVDRDAKPVPSLADSDFTLEEIGRAHV